MAKRFIECSLDQPYLLPPSLQDWLPASHLARFVADVAEHLDLDHIYSAYERKDGRGLAAYHPLMMTRVLLYAYAIGVRSSRAIEKATHDDIAFRYLSGDQHPDHDTIANFRQQHLDALAALFAQALQLCRRAGLVKLGVLAIDGTKIKAQASDRKSMRMVTLCAEEKRLQDLVERLLCDAAATDAEEDARWGKGQPADPLPPELANVEERLKRIREAKQALQEEAEQQLAEAEAAYPKRTPGRPRKGEPRYDDNIDRERRKQAYRRAKRAVAGETRHYNFTDPDSRMMLDGATGHVVQAYNAQLAVDAEAQIIVSAHVTQQPLDKQQLVPMMAAATEALGCMPECVVADTGYWNYSHLSHEVFADSNLLVPPDGYKSTKNPSVRADQPLVQDMRAKLKTLVGRRLYAARQQVVEPVFAHIKEHRRFRRFSFRGLAQVAAEWAIVCLTHNLLKLYRSQRLLTAV